jgi:hypothetical protein
MDQGDASMIYAGRGRLSQFDPEQRIGGIDDLQCAVGLSKGLI